MAFQARKATNNLDEDETFKGDNAIGSIKLKKKPVWIRAKDLRRDAVFVVDGATSHDLDQGKLGNCWFIAAAATLAATNRPLFERVVPLDQKFEGSYNGNFRFNFCWYDKWITMVVDDYLPTIDNQLVFCRNRERPNEFWPALLEKAYAKLNGSYAKLDGGRMHNAMVHLTGGKPEVMDIRQNSKLPSNLYDLLLASHSKKSLIGAAIFRRKGSQTREKERPNGLIKGHAYSVTGFKQLPQPGGTYINLLRLRNPWGRGEWKGAWSDGSKEMTLLKAEVKHAMEYENLEDGEFWMEFMDFLKNFDEIHLCHFQDDAFIERTGATAGGVTRIQSSSENQCQIS